MLLHHLHFAWRTLSRNKGFTILHIFGLATGICACIAIYTMVSYELSFDTFHPGGDRIYRVGGRIEEHGSAGFGDEAAPPTAPALRQEMPGLEAVARYYHYHASAAIRQKDGTRQTFDAPQGSGGAILTDSAYFTIFHYHWLAGDPATALAHPFSVVLTANQAQRYFGSASPESWLNREIVYEDSLHVHVSGIVRDWTGNTDFPYTDFIALSTIAGSPFLNSRFHPDSWQVLHGNPWMITMVKLAPHTDPARFEAGLTPFMQRHINMDPFLHLLRFSLVLQPLADIHFNAAYDHDGIRKANRPVLYALMGAAAFILLLAIINFINISTAQFHRKVKDTSIRRFLGSSRWQLMVRFIIETGLIILLATTLALLFVRPVFAAFHAYLPPELRFHPLDWPVLLFVLLLVLLTTLLAGAYPARVLSQSQPPRRYTVRKTLIVFQFTISLVFIIGSIVVGRQLHYMLNANLGFTKDAVLTVHEYSASTERLRLFAQQARKLPGIADLTQQGHAPAGDPIIEGRIQLESRKDKEQMVSLQAADTHFLAFYHIPLLAGRNILAGDSSLEVAINDTYRQALGFKDPGAALGHFLTWNGQSHPIVGVIADFHTKSFHDPIYPLLIGQLSDLQYSLAFRLSPGRRAITLAQLAKAWKSLFPDQPFEYKFLDASIAQLYQSDIQLAWLVHATTSLMIFLSCMGLLGLILFIVERKQKEISIRKVLGAGIVDIMVLLNKEFVLLIGIALCIAGPVAWYGLHRWLQDFAYRTAVNWWVFALAGLSALGIVILTIGIRVVKAALANPIASLRTD